MSTIDIRFSEPHPGQRKVLDEAKRFNVLQCGRRWGKTNLGVHQACITACEGFPVAWMAPTYKYLADPWREILGVLRPLQPSVNVQEKRIELPTKGALEFWSLDQPDPGRSRKYKRLIVDEAGMTPNLSVIWNEALRPTLVDLKGDAWFLGTPKGHNFFQKLYARGQSGDLGWMSWRCPTSQNPFIDPAEIEDARSGMPPSAFNQEFLGIPADDGGNPFDLQKIQECVGPLSNKPPVTYGGDLARKQDWTVLCGLDEDGIVSYLERWQSDWGQTKRRLIDQIGTTYALLDSTGVGDPIVEDLQRELPNVEGFNFSVPSKQKLMEGLSAAIQRGEIRFPPGWLVSELESFEYTFSGARTLYSAPSGMHDDGVYALALAVQKKSDYVHHRIRWGSGGVLMASNN